MARAGSPGMSRSRKNVTSVIPKTMITRCTSRRGSIPKRVTRLPPPGVGDGWCRSLVRADRQRLQGQVVVAERRHLESVHPVADAVPVRAVVGNDERGLLVHDLLDLVVHLLARGAAELGPGLRDQAVGLRVAPVAVEGVRAALTVGAERGDLIGVDYVVGPVPLAHLGVAVVLLVVGGQQLVRLDAQVDADGG